MLHEILHYPREGALRTGTQDSPCSIVYHLRRSFNKFIWIRLQTMFIVPWMRALAMFYVLRTPGSEQ
jgi:hypothetical protein